MSACVLYHFAFDPGSRAARLALGEARIDWRPEGVVCIIDAPLVAIHEGA